MPPSDQTPDSAPSHGDTAQGPAARFGHSRYFLSPVCALSGELGVRLVDLASSLKRRIADDVDAKDHCRRGLFHLAARYRNGNKISDQYEPPSLASGPRIIPRPSRARSSCATGKFPGDHSLVPHAAAFGIKSVMASRCLVTSCLAVHGRVPRQSDPHGHDGIRATMARSVSNAAPGAMSPANLVSS